MYNDAQIWNNMRCEKLRYKLLLLLPLLFALLAIAPSASGCGTLPSSISSLITACIPINVVNTNTITSNNFDMEFNALPFNALVGNVVVYNGISGSLMPSWAENRTIIWTNLGYKYHPNRWVSKRNLLLRNWKFNNQLLHIEHASQPDRGSAPILINICQI